MDKKQILQRLRTTIDKLITLKEEQFDNSMVISHFDKENPLNSICCVFGWYPVWFPETGLKYVYYNQPKFEPEITVGFSKRNNLLTINNFFLEDYHGLGEDLIQVLFFGKVLPEFGLFSRWLSKKEDILHIWNTIYDLLDKDIISPNYKIQ